MHATETLAEADRLMTVCNSCRYCEGLCAVFPAMEMRRAFTDGDLNYLANLCHACGACYYDCQFSPPHEFNVNVPKVLAKARVESYERYAWPPGAEILFSNNGLWIALLSAAAVALFLLEFAYVGPLWHAETGPGAFYRMMSHNIMAAVFGASFLYAFLALWMGLRAFWNDVGDPVGTLRDRRSLRDAAHDALRLRYLEGGKMGCYNENERPTDRRRLYHHLTFYGFVLCFLATCVGSFYHFFAVREAPYPWWDVPVVLGSLGGIGLVVGTAGLLSAKLRRDKALVDEAKLGMDTGFIVLLGLVGFSGLLLLVLRATPAMGILLAVHLGLVVAFFLSMPYSKFVHGVYRFAALMRYARERRALLGETPAPVATTGQGGTRP